MAYPDLAGAVNWSTCNGGNPPAAGDTLYLNTGCALTLDGANNSTYTCVAIKCATSAAPTTYNQSATVVLGNALSTIAANLYAGTTWMLTVGTGKTLTMGPGTTVYGGSGSVCAILVTSGALAACPNAIGGSGASAYGVIVNGAAGSVVITNATGGTGGNAAGLNITAGTASVVTATGSATNAASGIYQTGGTVTITNAIGGGVASAHGNWMYGGTCTITTAKGGSVAGASAVAIYSGTLTINGTDMTGVGQIIGGGTIKLSAGCKLAYQDAAGAAKTFYGADLMPAAGDVRTGTTYGGTDFTGSLASSMRAFPAAF